MIDLPEKLTLNDVYNYTKRIAYNPSMYSELNQMGLNPQLIWIKPNLVLTEEQKQNFMMLIIKYSP